MINQLQLNRTAIRERTREAREGGTSELRKRLESTLAEYPVKDSYADLLKALVERVEGDAKATTEPVVGAEYGWLHKRSGNQHGVS